MLWHMSNFEYKPEKKDPLAAMEELKHGKFSMTDEEREQITKKALVEGRDPEEAIREHEERLAKATERLREKQKEEAISDLERDMNKQFLNKKRENK